MTKICGVCKQELPIDSFNVKSRKNGKVSRQYCCKECNKQYLKQHYQNNKKYYKDKSKDSIKKNKTLLLEYLKDKKCKDCPETDAVVLEFDHLRDKEESVSILIRLASWQTVLKEIEKCDIVCANCHRRRTYKRANSYRYTGIV
jgi:hypothetical protein